MKTIWDNIKMGYQYLYITPATDQSFINEIITLFDSKKLDNLSNIYKMVTEKISHICAPDLFDVLPKDYDLCVYINNNNYEKRGFFTAWGIKDETENKIKYYYYPVPDELINRIVNKYAGSFAQEKIIQSYMSKKIKKQKSPIDGYGLFCKTGMRILKDEVLIIKGGYELHRNEMQQGKPIDCYLPIADDLFLGAKTKEDVELIKLFINHSCCPNVRMQGDRTFVAMKDISEGEELTIDYAFIDNENYNFTCHCNKPGCRGTISGKDWEKVKDQYDIKCFATYLQEKISNTKK
jgi:hypothetical protein